MIKETNEREIKNLEFLQSTNVNCPKIVKTYEANGKLFLETEDIEADSIALYLRRPDDEDLKIVANNLKREVEKLRELDFPYNYTTLQDPMFGEIDITSEENMFGSMLNKVDDAFLFKETVHKIEPRNTKFVLSNGSLDLGNILVKKDLSIFILDWANLSYLPEYWDMFKLVRFNSANSKFSNDILNHFNPNRLAIMCCIQYTHYLM